MPNSTRFRVIARIAGGAIGLSCMASGADAAEVPFPKDKPVVSMVVPDDWTVSYTPFGLEIESAEKNLYIVADLQPRRKNEAEAWAKKALVKIQAFGVSFDQRATPAVAAPAKSVTPTMPVQTVAPAVAAEQAATPAMAPPATPPVPAKSVVAPVTKPPEPAKPIVADVPRPTTKVAEPAAGKPPEPSKTDPSSTADAPPDREPFFALLHGGPKPEEPAPPNDDPMPVFSGKPSLTTPGKPNVTLGIENDAAEGKTLEELIKPAVSDLPSIPFRSGRYPAASWKNQPIDVEIVNFGLSSTQLFVVIQASLSTDDRAATVVKSVKRVNSAP